MEIIEKILQFLDGYPTYLKGILGLWIVLGAIVIGLFINSPRKNQVDNLLFVADINELWSPLMRDIKAISNPAEKRITVLGLTLYAAWNQLRPWILKPETIGWTIELYCLSPVTATNKFVDLLEPKWGTDSLARTSEIDEFIQNRHVELQARQIGLSLKPYNSFPAVHGFLLGTGKIYMSFTQWSDQTQKLDYGPHPYEIIEPNDKSARAEAYRNLFYNWLNRVKHTPTNGH